MRPTISIKTGALAANLKDLARLTGSSGADVLKSEAAKFVRQAVRFTPPKTLAQGRKAIARDIDRAVTTIDPAKARSERMRKVVEAQDYAAMLAILQKSNKGKAWRVEKFSPSLHRSVRDRRGRVRRQQKVLTPDIQQVKKYVAATQKQAGYARSGWVPAMRSLNLPVASWMGRHSTGKAGAVENNLTAANPSITMHHHSSKIPGYARIVDSALKSRAQAVNTLIMRVLERQSVNLGFKTWGPNT